MITKEYIRELADKHLEGTSLFVTKINVGAGNQIEVFIDGDKGVAITDCVDLSRFIEKSLDRDKEDFSLDVSSHGATNPLILARQYPKHIGKNFTIKMLDGTVKEGELTSADGDIIKISYSLRENKPVGKGKVTVHKEDIIQLNQIKESKIKLKF